jgi:dUTP pyrophosphatase
MKLSVKKLSPGAKVPTRMYHDDAGLDLYANEDYVLESGEIHGVPTGIAMAIPSGLVGLIWGKSGLALKAGIGVLGGVIDSQYRGEIVVIVTNHGAVNYRIEKGSKIAQILLQRVELLQAEEVDDLDTTFRGDGAFGSTGTH